MDLKTLLFAFILAIIGVILSYIAMNIEFNNVDLSLISWLRIFITLFITGLVAKEIEKRYL